ncbi:MAG: response regulator [Gemmatimonadaceae bacterium]
MTATVAIDELILDPVHLLLVEDSAGDADLVREYFSAVRTPLQLTAVESLAAAREALRDRLPDAVLLDLHLPDSSGIETLLRVRRLVPEVPAIVITGDLDHELRQQLLATGATACISKGSWTSEALTGAVRFAVKLRRALGAQRQLERVFANIPEGITVIDADGCVVFANEAAVTLLGKPREDLVGAPFEHAVSLGEARTVELTHGGQVTRVEFHAVPAEWEGRVSTLVTVRDTTESSRLAQQLFQAQKMEAVGLLAGGIAHDFNNLITVILAYGQSLKDALPHGDARHDDITHLLAAADRATALTRQLMAVARRHPVQEQLLFLGVQAQQLEPLLQKALPENAELRVNAEPDGWPIVADSGHIEQVLINLVVNARDAMPKGGTVTITIENVAQTPRTEEWPGGDAVCVRVADTGDGIPPANLPRIFQPFFTTKENGKGTGLGLATCYGIVHQAHGTIAVESTMGVGTVFTMLFPRASEDEAAVLTTPLATPDRLEGHETVLVVEDDEALRRSMVRSLRRFGYSILAATNGEEAQRVLDGHDGVIDLLLTDLVMPRVGGRELIATLRRSHPRLKVLCITGSAREIAELGLALPEAVEVLYKPFDPATLMRAVRRVLSAGE